MGNVRKLGSFPIRFCAHGGDIMKKRLLWGVLLLLVIAFTGAGITKVALKPGHEQPVAFIDQEPISQKEFAFFLDQQRASVYDYFKQKYGAGDSPSFWTDSFGGEVPLIKRSSKPWINLSKRRFSKSKQRSTVSR